MSCPFSGVLLFVPALLFTGGASVGAQEPNRIWGRVETAEGQSYEGYILWDGKESSWFDILRGTKERSREGVEALRALGRVEDLMKIVEVSGYRLSWEEPDSALWGIRFGHLRRLSVLDGQKVELELKSGTIVEMEGGGPLFGNPTRVIRVETPEQEYVGLAWTELAQIDFGPAPTVHRAEGARLHGTVEDRWGDLVTGYVSWNWHHTLTTDFLRGKEDGRDQRLSFRRIGAIEKSDSGAQVFLTSGERMVLSGSLDVGEGNLGIQISDPGLGLVEVGWSGFSSLRLHPPDAHVGYDALDGGHRLKGTVFTQAGEEFTGRVVWDADATYSWELLEGGHRDVVYQVEFGEIASIERRPALGVLVTLLDGRVLELEGSSDVSGENQGILIQVDDKASPEGNAWVQVDWGDFREVRFEQNVGESPRVAPGSRSGL